MDHFSYDPLTGVTKYFDYDEEKGEALIRSVQDVSSILEFAKACRTAEISKEQLKKDDYMCLHATIPVVVQLELMKKGIDIFDNNCSKRLMEEIETNYPYLKCSNFKHDR